MTSLINPSNQLYLMYSTQTLMRFLRILFMKSRQKAMTSSALMYSTQKLVKSTKKNGVTGPSYTTDII